MIRRTTSLLLAAILLAGAAAAIAPRTALGAPDPAWHLSATPLPTSFSSAVKNEILLVATNVGAAQTSGTVTITDTLPSGLTPTAASGRAYSVKTPWPSCGISGQMSRTGFHGDRFCWFPI